MKTNKPKFIALHLDVQGLMYQHYEYTKKSQIREYFKDTAKVVYINKISILYQWVGKKVDLKMEANIQPHFKGELWKIEVTHLDQPYFDYEVKKLEDFMMIFEQRLWQKLGIPMEYRAS